MLEQPSMIKRPVVEATASCWSVSSPRSTAASSRADPMSKTTRATQVLAKAGVDFTVHTYDYDPNAERIGLQAAEAIGEEPHRVLKTLMAEVDGKPVCVVVPSDHEVSMKKLAAPSAASRRT
jgi:hypothetical protein